MNKEPKEVDWSKQKPGTIGVTRTGDRRYEFVAARGRAACFHTEEFGFATRTSLGKLASDPSWDILLPWESQIAEGHNPDGLTNQQVGDGFRLLRVGEQICELTQGCSKDQHKTWFAAVHGYTLESSENITYRVPITKTKRKAPCGPEHFPPGVVLRKTGATAFWQVVTKVRSSEVMTPNYDGELNSITFKQLVEDQVERSIDGGKTWLPCYVETEE